MASACPETSTLRAPGDRVRPDILIPGLTHPEDLVHVPGTAWLIASGIGDGRFQSGGLHLVDTARAKARPLPFAQLHDTRQTCGDAPDPMLFSAHGMYLSAAAEGTHTLYVVNHGGRESVEVFRLECPDPAQEPRITWARSVRVPEGLMAYSVAARADGSILVTASAIGRAWEEGMVYEHRDESGWRAIPGSEVPGANGIELSRDTKSAFVNSYIGSRLVRVPLAADAPARREIALPYMPDNIRLSPNGMLHAAGHVAPTDDIRRFVMDPSIVHEADYEVSEIDPDTLKVTHLLSGQGTPEFGLATSAVMVDNMIWLGTVRGQCLAGFRHPAARIAN